MAGLDVTAEGYTTHPRDLIAGCTWHSLSSTKGRQSPLIYIAGRLVLKIVQALGDRKEERCFYDSGSHL